MTKPVVNIADIEFQPRAASVAVPATSSERFEAKFARIGSLVGAKQLGYNITAVPPGKRAFPRHSHRVNEGQQPWLLATLVGAVVLIHYVVIRREEQYLEQRFRAEYLDYMASVRRWL